ncbi:MAG: dihydroxyacetone kinase phosphoryl donor subunit DhaM [Christensenellales bacterium]|jgi:PTS hybrid protein
MVSIVIVSHSEKVAAGAAEIAAEMNTANIPIVAAGGTGDGRIGTNAERIVNAINSVYCGDDILVFADLGSAILSTEMAMDLLDPEVAAKVRIVDAPIVEGVVVAAIQAGLTDNVDEIIEVAEGSKLIPKIQKG